ncbi:MAG: ABC transporter ATP-binding protein [Finegoldia sp.]|nr:ABC transporter ATP-binding protein [Finegoldia sp.]
MSILKLENITFSYKDKEVLSDISFEIYEGEIVSLVGKSGIGKSTLLKIICGLESPDVGKIYLDGKDITDISPNKRNIVMTLQDSYLFPHMSVEDNIGFSMKMRGEKKDIIKARVVELLKIIKLEGYENKKPKELSGGEKKRVALARAICDFPRILLLDEPFTGLDPEIKGQMLKLVQYINKKHNMTILMVTHDLDDAKNISDRILRIEDRKLHEVYRSEI